MATKTCGNKRIYINGLKKNLVDDFPKINTFPLKIKLFRINIIISNAPYYNKRML